MIADDEDENPSWPQSMKFKTHEKVDECDPFYKTIFHQLLHPHKPILRSGLVTACYIENNLLYTHFVAEKIYLH